MGLLGGIGRWGEAKPAQYVALAYRIEPGFEASLDPVLCWAIRLELSLDTELTFGILP
jgi:hypothetical protein